VTILQSSPTLRIARFRDEISIAVNQVLNSGHYILGPHVEKFESEFASYHDVKHCIGVASGTDALFLSLKALNIGPGDEVITTSLTFTSTASAILQCGATPIFADVDPITRCINPDEIINSISHRTAAILPVHLFGHPAEMSKIMEIASHYKICVVEDCAQAHGATIGSRIVGSFGNAAAFSFYPTKNLGGVGDGGAVLTNDDSIATALRRLRNYGFSGKIRISEELGFNSRLDEIQAAVLSVLLKYLNQLNLERRAVADDYRTNLATTSIKLPPSHPGAIYHQFAIEHPARNELAKFLGDNGVETSIHYSPPLHQHPAFEGKSGRPLLHTERLSAELLSLPIQPEIIATSVKEVAQLLIVGARKS